MGQKYMTILPGWLSRRTGDIVAVTVSACVSFFSSIFRLKTSGCEKALVVIGVDGADFGEYNLELPKPKLNGVFMFKVFKFSMFLGTPG
jgi:hypothetical protein